MLTGLVGDHRMELNTERLRLIPLSLDQFKLLLHGQDALERALGLDESGEEADEHIQQALCELYRNAREHQTEHPPCTHTGRWC